jgi:hypothetical protein
MRTDGQTGAMTKLTVALRNFAKTPKNKWLINKGIIFKMNGESLRKVH